MEVVTARPGPGVRRFAGRYVGYRLEGFAAGVHRGLPSRHLTFIVSLSNPIAQVGQSCGRQAIVAGLHPHPALIAHDGNHFGIALEVTPLGARGLLGLPAGELAGITLEPADLLGPALRCLPERLASLPSWRERFALLDETLAMAAPRRTEPPAEVVYAWQRLQERVGCVSIAALAAEVGWSRRHLLGRFRAEIGLAPKTAARLVRFDAARRALEKDPSRSLAALATECGYYDQSHLDREFKAFAGCPPSTWLAEEFPSVQAAADGHVSS